MKLCTFYMAERVGFEPTVRCRTTVFKTASLNHSDIPPKWAAAPPAPDAMNILPHSRAGCQAFFRRLRKILRRPAAKRDTGTQRRPARSFAPGGAAFRCRVLRPDGAIFSAAAGKRLDNRPGNVVIYSSHPVLAAPLPTLEGCPSGLRKQS